MKLEGFFSPCFFAAWNMLKQKSSQMLVKDGDESHGTIRKKNHQTNKRSQIHLLKLR